MKKIQRSVLIFSLIIITAATNAQPQLAGPLSFNGTQNGGGIFRLNLPGNTPGIIYNFNHLQPHLPVGGVCAGDEDWLYGLVTYNGTNNEGAAYRIRKDGTGFTKLFDLGTGARAIGTPYYHTDGKIYFNAENAIKVFDPITMGVASIDPNGFATSKNFLIDSDDYIYYLGFSQVSKVKTDGTDYTQLHIFNGATDGFNGDQGLTEVPGGTLFGLQKTGGASDGGTIFSIQKDGAGFTVHHQFTNATGYNPESKLEYFDGKLYGTTSRGGNSGNGVLYCINADGTDYRVQMHFESSGGPTPDPRGNIQITTEGRVFGSYSQFHRSNLGETTRLWKVDTSGFNLQNFTNVDQRQLGHMNLDILLTNDSLFLVTGVLGRHDGGVLSLVDTSAFMGLPMHHFGSSPNGFFPKSGFIKGSDGRLYGTTTIGGPDGNGVVYSINANGSGFADLHTFTDAEAYEPNGKLLEASDGKIYGVCRYGGPINTGCLFRMDKNGDNFEIIYTFSDLSQGHWPDGGVIEGPGGILYGMFTQGSNGSGLFRINLDGTGYTVIKFFVAGELTGPAGGLRLYRGYLYGACQSGGNLYGGIFRIRPDGTGYQQLHVFNQTDGAFLTAAPTIASNGRIYGVAQQGGNNNYGVLFGIDTSGTNFTIYRHFDDFVDGSYPQEPLIQASDGLIYGTTAGSFLSPGGSGTVFRMNLDGSGFTTLKEFNLETEGSFPGSIIDLNASALPVQWVDFTARQKQQTVLLEWQTAQEQNAHQFIIERSGNNSAFKVIGTVTATGNTATGARYSFLDNDPMNGNNYYRLKQTDRDGKFTFSKTLRIDFEPVAGLVLSPNPAQDNLTIKLSAGEQVKAVVITDAAGRVVKRQSQPGSSVINISIGGLSKGTYWLQVETGQKTYHAQFMKL